MLTVKDIATQLRTSEQHIRNLIRSKTLTGTRIGRQWIVKPKDLEDFIRKSNFVEVKTSSDSYPFFSYGFTVRLDRN